MVNPFHQVKNAKTAMENVERRGDTRIERIDEELGHAELRFRFTGEATLKSVRAIHKNLTDAGFEEQREESTIGGTAVYTWDKKNLSPHNRG